MRKTVVLAVTMVAMSTSLIAGQWLAHRDPRLPRTREGQPNLSAPPPRTGGHPDLSGVWQVEPTSHAEMQTLFGDIRSVSVIGDDTFDDSKYFLNILADFPSVGVVAATSITMIVGAVIIFVRVPVSLKQATSAVSAE